MQKNIITNKITPCCGLPFSVIYWWVSNLTLNSESDRQYLLTQISQSGVLSIDGWKVLINSGTLETDASLTKAEFLEWFDCGKQPTCEQLKLIIEGYKISNWDYYKNSIEELNEAFQELENKLKLKYNDVSETEAVDIIQRVDQFTGENVNYREVTTWYDGTPMTDAKLDNDIFIKKGIKYYKKQIDKQTLLKINTIADLRNHNGYYEGQEVVLMGYYEAGDKEPLTYKWTLTQGVDDGGSIINSNIGSWVAIWSDKAWKSTKDFGLHSPDITNHTPYLQTMLDLGGRIFIDPSVIYKNSSLAGLKITQSNTEIAGLKGVSTIEQLGQYNISINSGSANPDDNITNVKIHGIIFKNNKGIFNEHKHSMNFNGFTNLEIYNCELIGFEGDGIYIGSSNIGGATERHNFNLKIYNNVIDGINGENRNAISIIDCKGAEIFNNSIKNCTKSTMPGAIDIEPNANTFHVCQDIKIYNNELYNIGGNAGIFCIYGNASDYTNKVKNISIYGNKVLSGGGRSNGLGFIVVSQQSDILAEDEDNNIQIFDNIFESGTCSRPYNVNKVKGITFRNNIYSGITQPALIGFSNKVIKFKSIKESVFNSLTVFQIFRLTYFEDVEIIGSKIENSASTHLILLAPGGVGKNIKIDGLEYTKKDATATWFIFKDATFNVTGDNIEGVNFVEGLNSSDFFNYKNVKIIIGNTNLNPISRQGESLIYVDNSLANDNINARYRIKLQKDSNNSGWTDVMLIKIGNTASKPTTPYRGQLYNNTDTNIIEVWSGTQWQRMFTQSSSVENITTADATDLATALTLVNELKSKLNAKLTADRNSGQQAT